MRTKLLLTAVLLTAACSACKKTSKPASEIDTTVAQTQNDGTSRTKTNRTVVPNITPPFDVATPPADAIKTASGLTYKIISTVADSKKPSQNDTVFIQYTSWRPTGETYFTTTTRKRPASMPIGSVAPGLAEGLQLLGKGDKAMLWIPADIGYRSKTASGASDMAYEVEVVDIASAPEVPADVAAPPASVKKSASGIAHVVLTPGTGTEHPAVWDDVTYSFTSWDAKGKMLESSTMRQRPVTSSPFRQSPGLSEALRSMVVGERTRFWIPAALAVKRKPPTDGTYCYEIEVTEITKKPAPPEAPKDVGAPPKDALTTEAGVRYKVLTPGTGTTHPTATQAVRVNYTGWTTNGDMFDSSVLAGRPYETSLGGVIGGWTDGIQKMVVGETTRFWVPESLAYKGAPGRPQGMLVFDIELLEIKDAASSKPSRIRSRDGMPRTKDSGGLARPKSGLDQPPTATSP